MVFKSGKMRENNEPRNKLTAPELRSIISKLIFWQFIAYKCKTATLCWLAFYLHCIIFPACKEKPNQTRTYEKSTISFLKRLGKRIVRFKKKKNGRKILGRRRGKGSFWEKFSSRKTISTYKNLLHTHTHTYTSVF